MVRRKSWTSAQEKLIIDNYSIKTIQELMEMLPNKSQDSINAKIKRLKIAGKIKGGRDQDTVDRAYQLRK